MGWVFWEFGTGYKIRLRYYVEDEGNRKPIYIKNLSRAEKVFEVRHGKNDTHQFYYYKTSRAYHIIILSNNEPRAEVLIENKISIEEALKANEYFRQEGQKFDVLADDIRDTLYAMLNIPELEALASTLIISGW